MNKIQLKQLQKLNEISSNLVKIDCPDCEGSGIWNDGFLCGVCGGKKYVYTKNGSKNHINYICENERL